LLDWLRRRWRRRRGRSSLLASLHQLHDLVAHLGLDRAELVLDVDAVLLAQGHEILALHLQLARQREDTDLLFLLLLL
jgi:hypothetical protein